MNEYHYTETCRYPLTRLCDRGGYQDPNDCDRCRCPEGFTGRYCQKLLYSNTGQFQ